jgi:hypothetical protein
MQALPTVIVDVPYETRIWGIPARRRTPDLYFHRDTVPVEIPVYEGRHLDGIEITTGARSSLYPVVEGRVHSPVMWAGMDGDAFRNLRHVEPVQLALGDMATFAAVAVTKDGLGLERSPFWLSRVEAHGAKISRYHEKRLVADGQWREIIETDREAAKANAIRLGGRMSVVDGMVHTSRFQPILANASGDEWDVRHVDVDAMPSETSFSLMDSRLAIARPDNEQPGIRRISSSAGDPDWEVPLVRIACCRALGSAMLLVYPRSNPETAPYGSGSLTTTGVSRDLVEAVFACRGAVRLVDDMSVPLADACTATVDALEAFDAALGAESPLWASLGYGGEARRFRASVAEVTRDILEAGEKGSEQGDPGLSAARSGLGRS